MKNPNTPSLGAFSQEQGLALQDHEAEAARRRKSEDNPAEGAIYDRTELLGERGFYLPLTAVQKMRGIMGKNQPRT